MNVITEGKLRTLIEIRHKNDEITTCFVFPDEETSILNLLNDRNLFIVAELLSGETIFIAKDDIKAFKIPDTQSDATFSIWSFDPYTVLGVEPNIDARSLFAHYTELLKKTHPDVVNTKELHPAFRGLATDMTRRIISAFEFIRADISASHTRKMG